jgi:hypothetical protein
VSNPPTTIEAFVLVQPSDDNSMVEVPITQEIEMGKYIFAWILGVPAVVLVGVYVISHW